MKIGIIGAGRVGCACALAAVVRASARTIVIVLRTRRRAKAVAADLRYGSPLCPKTTVVDGDYEDLADAELVMITAGINEKTGGAIDRSDRKGRLRLLDTNAEIYRDIVPRVVRAAPGAQNWKNACSSAPLRPRTSVIVCPRSRPVGSVAGAAGLPHRGHLKNCRQSSQHPDNRPPAMSLPFRLELKGEAWSAKDLSVPEVITWC